MRFAVCKSFWCRQVETFTSCRISMLLCNPVDKWDVAKIMISICDTVENMVEKQKMLDRYQHFLLFPQCFKASLSRVVKIYCRAHLQWARQSSQQQLGVCEWVHLCLSLSVQTITSIMDGFKKKLAQLFSLMSGSAIWRFYSGRSKVMVMQT